MHPSHPPRSGAPTRKHRFQVVPPGDLASVGPPEHGVHLVALPCSGDVRGGRTAVLHGADLPLGLRHEGVFALLREVVQTGAGLLRLGVVPAGWVALEQVLAVRPGLPVADTAMVRRSGVASSRPSGASGGSGPAAVAAVAARAEVTAKAARRSMGHSRSSVRRTPHQRRAPADVAYGRCRVDACMRAGAACRVLKALLWWRLSLYRGSGLVSGPVAVSSSARTLVRGGVLEASPSPVYGAALLMRFGS